MFHVEPASARVAGRRPAGGLKDDPVPAAYGSCFTWNVPWVLTLLSMFHVKPPARAPVARRNEPSTAVAWFHVKHCSVQRAERSARVVG